MLPPSSLPQSKWNPSTWPVMVWLNLGSQEEPGELYHHWQKEGAKLCLRAGRKAVALARVPESPTWTTTNCAFSTTFHRTHRTSRGKFVVRRRSTNLAIETDYKFAPKASRRPSQSFTTNSRGCQGVFASPRANSTPRASYSAYSESTPSMST